MSDLAIVIDVDAQNPIEGDLRLIDGQVVLVNGTDAIRQDAQVRLRWFKGEWFMDRRTGVPWFQSILGQKNADTEIERILRKVISTTPGIAAITQFSLSHDTTARSVSLDFKAKTIAGDVISFSDFVLFPEAV